MTERMKRRLLNDKEKAYFKAAKRLEKETNIVSIIRDLREMKRAFQMLLSY